MLHQEAAMLLLGAVRIVQQQHSWIERTKQAQERLVLRHRVFCASSCAVQKVPFSWCVLGMDMKAERKNFEVENAADRLSRALELSYCRLPSWLHRVSYADVSCIAVVRAAEQHIQQTRIDTSSWNGRASCQSMSAWCSGLGSRDEACCY